MKHLTLATLTYLAAVLQSSAEFRVPYSDVPLLFLPLVMIYAVFLLDGWVAVMWAAGIGLISDALKAGPLGVDMLCGVLVSGVVLQVYRRENVRSTSTNLQFAASMIFLFETLSLALGTAVAQRTVPPDRLFTVAALQSLGTIACGAIVLLLWNAVRPLVRSRQRHGY